MAVLTLDLCVCVCVCVCVFIAALSQTNCVLHSCDSFSLIDDGMLLSYSPPPKQQLPYEGYIITT